MNHGALDAYVKITNPGPPPPYEHGGQALLERAE